MGVVRDLDRVDLRIIGTASAKSSGTTAPGSGVFDLLRVRAEEGLLELRFMCEVSYSEEIESLLRKLSLGVNNETDSSR